MNTSRLPLLVLAAPILLSACGSGTEAPVQAREQAAVRAALSVAVPYLAAVPESIVLQGPRDSFNIARTGTGYSVTDRRTGQLVNVPATARVRFDDTSVGLDIDGVAGKAYRLYKAAFGRAPDIAGLSFWIKAMDAGAAFEAVANGFSQSAESRSLYGEKPTNAEMVARLYLNVLGREGDAAGIAYWVDALDKNRVSQTQVLADFSESAENKAALAPATRLGIAYREPGVSYATAPTARGFSYRTLPAPVTAAAARVRLNEQGALGYAWVTNVNHWSGDWAIDLYASATPDTTYQYELDPLATGSPEERLNMLNQWGAKGYLYKSMSVFGYETLSPYDVFIKSSGAGTTYAYRLDSEPVTVQSLNRHGVQGYAYRDYLYMSGSEYALYAKDQNSDAMFDYVLAQPKSFDDGMMEQINTFGADAYAYLGQVRTGEKFAALFMRSSTSAAPFIYTSAPKAGASAREASAQFALHAQRGEAYWQMASGKDGVMAIFYKGAWVARPFVGPTFP